MVVATSFNLLHMKYPIRNLFTNSIVNLVIVLSTLVAAASSTLLADDYEIRKSQADADWQAKRIQMELDDFRQKQARLEAEMRQAKAEIQQAEIDQQLKLARIKREEKLNNPVVLDDDLYDFYIRESRKIFNTQGLRELERKSLHKRIRQAVMDAQAARN